MRRTFLLPVLLITSSIAIGLACPLATAQTSNGVRVDSALPQLLHPVELIPPTSRVIGPEVMRRRAVTIDAELLMTLDPDGDNQLVFSLFPDVTLTGRVEGKTFPGTGVGFPDTFSLSGSIPGEPGSSFQLVFHRGVLAGDIRVPGIGEYQIRPTAPPAPPDPPGLPGSHEVWEIDNSQYPTCALGDQQQVLPVPADKAQKQSSSSLLDDGSRIDVMIVYTTAAKLVTGGTISTEAEVILSVANTNTAYTNSLVATQLFLVHMSEITYAESGNASTDLNRLTNIGDGFLDSVHTTRDSIGADNVGLFVSSFDACGVAWLMTTVAPSFESLSFNVSAIGCAAGNLTYAHEVGHNLGCHHNRGNTGGGQGAFPYSFGYQDPGLSFRTVLAFSNGTPRVMQISNPDVLFGGDPTGVAEGQADSADNAKTINNTAFTMANFRVSLCGDPLPIFDCNGNCIEDADDITAGTSLDCNLNNIPDLCDVLSGSSLDCNANNIPDECEDCNNNGIADSCEFAAVFSEASPELSPIGLGFPVSHTFVAPPVAQGDVTLGFEAIAHLVSTTLSLDVFLNNDFQGRIFRTAGSTCPATPDVDSLVVLMADYNLLIDGGDAVIRIETFDSVEFDVCGGSSWVSVSLDYPAAPEVEDVNGNGIPDICDLARGDSNLDGFVNVTDLLALLAAWGICPACVEDTNLDGSINVTDLLALLAGWG